MTRADHGPSGRYAAARFRCCRRPAPSTYVSSKAGCRITPIRMRAHAPSTWSCAIRSRASEDAAVAEDRACWIRSAAAAQSAPVSEQAIQLQTGRPTPNRNVRSRTASSIRPRHVPPVRRNMRHLAIPPSSTDVSVAKAAARHTNPAIQNIARAATWAADGHVLGTVAAAVWLLSRLGNSRRRAVANHLAVTVAAAVIVPKILKQVVERTRPDRVVVGPHRRGVKTSGNPHDSFPSGHSVHIGAVVSALSRVYPKHATVFRATGAMLACTRVGVLAHWTTDVVAGLTMGIALESGVAQILDPHV
jgi:hypothetical protein